MFGSRNQIFGSIQRRRFFLTVSYDEPHGPSLCPAPYNTMYRGFKFEPSAKFTDDLKNKPLMQQLWAGDKLTADENRSTKVPKD